MATKTTKKTTKKTTRKTTATTTARKTTEPEPTPIGEKACIYPSCSQRATKEVTDKKVPCCDVHAPIIEAQAEDGAGIQQLVENYKEQA